MYVAVAAGMGNQFTNQRLAVRPDRPTQADMVWSGGLMSVAVTIVIFLPQLPFAVTVICLVMMSCPAG